MSKKHIYIGNQKAKISNAPIKGDFIKINNETFYKIENYDKMNPFLISIVSATDHWLYISSKGGLTAGRKNSDNSLFAYTNDDVLHDVNEITGSKTIIKMADKGKLYLWEPFSENYRGIYSITKNLYKNISSTEIIFEEINHDLKLKFQYSWTCSEKYGFVKTSKIFNESSTKKEIEVLDGIQNILPSGVSQKLQSGFSTLIDGYKKNELISKYGLGVYSLSSIPSDRALPAESLKATTVWAAGIDVEKYLLSSKQISNFRKNISIEQEDSINGMSPAVWLPTTMRLPTTITSDRIRTISRRRQRSAAGSPHQVQGAAADGLQFGVTESQDHASPRWTCHCLTRPAQRLVSCLRPWGVLARVPIGLCSTRLRRISGSRASMVNHPARAGKAQDIYSAIPLDRVGACGAAFHTAADGQRVRWRRCRVGRSAYVHATPARFLQE